MLVTRLPAPYRFAVPGDKIHWLILPALPARQKFHLPDRHE
ncbi:hypothetical protein ymoll0001_16050 [Yersinia mollaretii ATCC 43969]|uniref:Uncharacterized protein n=1 Tax=Yersinia mollaretii (strain ATCC 43969 / DSM 18520 / CIP 103324 / CNY 7263 / WAIP 204) TaxID=349967 RepID=A0ABP2ENT8_YERMW|nr:hypothetical protein ymoll0001_16050 [Yersinia mollaretii ATCC 43969]